MLFKFNQKKTGIVNYSFIKQILCARSQDFLRIPKNRKIVPIHWEFRAKLEREKTNCDTDITGHVLNFSVSPVIA